MVSDVVAGASSDDILSLDPVSAPSLGCFTTEVLDPSSVGRTVATPSLGLSVPAPDELVAEELAGGEVDLELEEEPALEDIDGALVAAALLVGGTVPDACVS